MNAEINGSVNSKDYFGSGFGETSAADDTSGVAKKLPPSGGCRHKLMAYGGSAHISEHLSLVDRRRISFAHSVVSLLLLASHEQHSG